MKSAFLSISTSLFVLALMFLKPNVVLSSHLSDPSAIARNLVNKTVNDYFAEAKKTYTNPAFVNLGLSVDQMKTSIIDSILQVTEAPTAKYDQSTQNVVLPQNKYTIFNQADRQSCSVTAMAAGMSASEPAKIAEIISSLYWTGKFPTSISGMPNPCPYVLALNPNDDTNCPNCMEGAEFVMAVSFRDSRNQDLGHYTCSNVPEMYKVTAQSNQGKVFLAVPDDEIWFCKKLYGTDCKLIQGNPACSSDPACMTLLKDLLPIELSSLKTWAEDRQNAVILFGGQNGTLAAYTGTFDKVKTITEMPNLKTLLLEYYNPVTEADIQSQCDKGAFICLDDIPMQIPCAPVPSTNQVFGCQQSPNTNNPTCATLGQSPCLANHWVLIRDCDTTAGTVNVWSWGGIFRIPYKQLAGMTTSIVEIPTKSVSASLKKKGLTFAMILVVSATLFLMA